MWENNTVAAAFVDYLGMHHCRSAVSKVGVWMLATRLTEVDCNRGLEIEKRPDCTVWWKRVQRLENAIQGMLAGEEPPEERWKTFRPDDECDERVIATGCVRTSLFFFLPQFARALVLEVGGLVLCRIQALEAAESGITLCL